MKPIPSPLTSRAQSLRRNMTPEERRLWYDFLKPLPLTFRRQKVIEGIIVDFCCDKARIVIEIDGSQHQTDEGMDNDRLRDESLRKKGYSVARYTNEDIRRNFTLVCRDILERIEGSSH